MPDRTSQLRLLTHGVYVSGFMLLGLLLSTIIHAAIEIPLMWLVANDPMAYANVWWWRNWEVIHGVGSLTLWFAGLVLGFLYAERCWRRVPRV